MTKKDLSQTALDIVKMDVLKITEQDLDALQQFRNLHPTWWYTIGFCDLSRDFSCAPQKRSPEEPLIQPRNCWDNGFHCDHEGNLADAIFDVIEQIKKAQ